MKIPAGHRNRHACAANTSANHSMAKYCTAGSSENVAVDDDTIFPVLFCVVKHKFVGQIEWAWVTHLFSSSVFSYFVLLFSMLSVSFPLHERRATSDYVILVRTSHMTMRMRCYAGRDVFFFVRTFDIINTNGYFCLSMVRIKLPAVEINFVIYTWYVKTKTVCHDALRSR